MIRSVSNGACGSDWNLEKHRSYLVAHLVKTTTCSTHYRQSLKGILNDQKLAMHIRSSPTLLPRSRWHNPSTWVPDKAHSGVEFSILHMGLSNVRGHFGNIGGTLVVNDADITKSSVNVTIDVTTVDTGVGQRDGDLKGANFFDVAQFPTATFVSTSVAKSGSGLTVSGNLTLHGVTKPVVLQVEGPTGPVPGMDKKPHSGFLSSYHNDQSYSVRNRDKIPNRRCRR